MRTPASSSRLQGRTPFGAVLVLAIGLSPWGAWANTGSATGQNPTARAELTFSLSIGKFIYLRLGDATAISTVNFTLSPSVPASPITGNSRAVSWNGTAPTATVTSSGNVLPVYLRSNGGAVSLKAATEMPLSNGSATIPMSQISVSSDSSNLPAPSLSTGASVTVPGSSFGGLVTDTSAYWTFNYTGTSMPAAGTYSGQVSFTASTP